MTGQSGPIIWKRDDDYAGTLDFVMKFEHQYLEDLKGKKREKAEELKRERQDILKKIKHCGLHVAVKQSSKLDKEGRPEAYFVIVSGTEAVFKEKAEELKMQKLLKKQYWDVDSDFQGYGEYARNREDQFEPGRAGFFTSLERQRIIYRKLEGPLIDVDGVKGAALDLDSLRKEGVISDFAFMHDQKDVSTLMGTWVKDYIHPAPIHDVRAYLGDKVGFYFAFMDHYCAMLAPLAIVSLAVFIYQLVIAEIDNVLIPFYCVVMAIWTTVMLELWKRRQATLAYQWALEDFVEDEPSRPEYISNKLTTYQQGVFTKEAGFVEFNPANPAMYFMDAVEDLMTGEQGGAAKRRVRKQIRKENKERIKRGEKALEEDKAMQSGELVFPYNVHVQRVILSLLFTAVLISAVAVGALFILAYKLVLRKTWDETYGNYVGSLMNVLFISLTDQIWSRLALLLNDWEMYRTDSEWFNALIYKTFCFRFINKNATPLYIAFVQGQNLALFGFEQKDECPQNDCLQALSQYLLVAVVFSEASRNLLTLVPLALDILKKKYYERKAAKAAAKKAGTGLEEGAAPPAADAPPSTTELIEWELYKTEYPGTFEEMLEMSIQFGYVTMFAVAFPVSPAFVLLNNLIERKTDALKTLRMRRPRYMGSQGIGNWLYVLEFLTIVSVVTNMLIMFFSSKQLRALLPLSDVQVLLVVVVIEHLLFVLKAVIAMAVPDTPRWVQRARIRKELREQGTSEEQQRKKNKEALDALKAQPSENVGDDGGLTA